MPKYIIQHTPVLHGAEKDKQTTRYEVGDMIELTEKEAQKLGDNVAAAKVEKNENSGDDAGKEKEKKKQQ
ncbi:MAG: hypothetical protein OS130_09995 [Thermodesulfobacteriota bacterium]|jgi:hypothetical protein|nr:MAG: hypothetical protein OS130_09995 [Thermodesulfobacteriota bacterium]